MYVFLSEQRGMVLKYSNSKVPYNIEMHEEYFTNFKFFISGILPS